MPDAATLESLMRQSPIAAVLVVILFYYRRDMQRMQAKEEEKTSILTNLVGDCRGAIAANTAQSANVERAVDQLRSALNLPLPAILPPDRSARL
jgi:hypothetical protein